jgi:SNF2 family DNA or RNA helicase
VLSGTPLENRLDDLYSVVEFIDDRRLGPAFRFINRHRVTDEKGKVCGYKDLDLLPFTRALTSSVSTPSFDSTTPHTSRRSISA